MKKRMIKLMTIFCMAGILTVNPVIIGLAEEESAVGAEVQKAAEPGEEPAAEEDSVENNQVVITSTEENVPAVMDLLPNAVKYVEINWNDDDSSPKKNTYQNGIKVGTSIKLNENSATRSGYDFIGWYKNDTFLSGSDDQNYAYTFTEEDVKAENVIFTAGWRQKVEVTVDAGTASTLNAKAGSTASQATYDLKTVTEQLIKPGDSYVFANKWVVNDEGPYDAANDTLTVMFDQTNGKLVFNAVNVNVDGKTNVKTGNNIKLTSCWNLVDGQYNLRIENKTTGILTANQKEAAVNEIIDIENVSNKDDIEFKKGNWTLKKPVSDLAEGSIKYVNRNGKYYQYRESTIKDSDFEKTVTYIYRDDSRDTTFSNTGTGTATIHPGVEDQTWESILPKNATAMRGDFTFAGWRYFLNGKENIDPEKTIINFYNDDEHSLTVKPIWNGSYSYKPNFPTNQGPEKDPKVQEQEVGTVITLQTLDNIAERYTFEGWIDSDGNTYKGGKSYTIKKANETFTGQWKAVPHKLTFVDEDKSVYSEGTADFNTPITWPSKPTKEGYTFQNWLVEINKDEIKVEHGEKFIMQDQDITFIAQWMINSYQISYDGNGAAMGVPAGTVEQNYQTDYTIDKVVPTKTGYTFQGWSDGTTTYQPGAVFKVPARDVVLTAQWKANSHQVKYDGNGGKTSAPESKSADYNSNVSVAAGLEKDGYLFDGWEQISTGKVLTPGASFVMPDMDETLKAKWKIAYTGIYEAGVYYLIQGQSYILGPGRKAQGDSSTYTANVTIYVPQSGYYTFE